jgi:hypothetical protein
MSISESTKLWIKLVQEDQRSEATEFTHAFEWLQTSHYILNANYQELKAIPERFDTDRSLLNLANRSEQDALHFEFIRRLHNYLASVKTLVDHTRTFRSRHVRDEGFDQGCEVQLSRLRDDPVVKFLQEFRNPVLHSHLPRVALTTTFPDGKGIRRQLTMSVVELRGMHDWSHEALRYIDEAQQGYDNDRKYVDVAGAAQKYQEAVTAFYTWFYESIGTVKGPMLAEFIARRTELARLHAEMHARTNERPQEG